MKTKNEPRSKYTPSVFLFGILAAFTLNQLAVSAPRHRAVGESPSTFKTSGLINHALVTRLYEGDFVNIDLDRTDSRFGILYQQYLEAFARHCTAALPPNKVEMTRSVCNEWSVGKNGYGMEVSRVCVGYKQEPTNLFAKPALYDALNALNRLKAADMGRELSRMFGDVTRPDGLSNLVGLVGDARTLVGDMDDLVRANGCKSAGLLRFEDNLRLFALNKQPIGSAGDDQDSSATEPGDGKSFKDQDYRALIEDLVLDDTKRWGAFARFVNGSITNAVVAERDKRGRPTRVVAPYQWDGMGRTSGRVTLTFSDGQPECLTYSETASVCHTPNRRIAARYLKGGYGE